MQTHYDDDARREFMDLLRKKAKEYEERGLSRITAGRPGEEELASWKANGVSVRHLPDDEHGVLRISIGGGDTPVPLNYLVFRGEHGACVNLLRKALAALESCP